jgi:RHS repeat-associated protein
VGRSYYQHFMVATYSLQRITSTPGKVEARVASHVWGPDIGSNLEARSPWQEAGGVGGLLMSLYPTSAAQPGYPPNYLVKGPAMDHLGNVTSVFRLESSAGLAQVRTESLYDYDAFGKEIRSTALIAGSNPDSYPFHFSTKYTDGETGLVYYGYRFYDTVNGRWINRDPIEEEGGVNLYGMLGNDGVNVIDYLGFSNRPPWPKDCKGFLKDGEDGFVEAMNRVFKDAKHAKNQEKRLKEMTDEAWYKKHGTENKNLAKWKAQVAEEAENYWAKAAEGCKSAEKLSKMLADCLKVCAPEDLDKMKIMEALLKDLLEKCKNMRGDPQVGAPGTPNNPGLAPDEPANTKPGEWKPEYSPDGSDYTPDPVRPGNGQVRPAPLRIRPAVRPAPARPLMPAR